MKLAPLVVLVSAVALTACASKGNRGRVDSRPASTAPAPGPATRGLNDFEGGQVRPFGPGVGAASPDTGAAMRPSENIVYFEFDSADINAEGLRLIDAYGRFLAANPAARVRLEGHTDERGTREYNVALGERRALSVEQALLRAGATPAQIVTLSYGEERPTCREASESCWSRNRRVEIIRL